ncbi:MAG: PAS domain S-box protein [Mariniphaga sp.]
MNRQIENVSQIAGFGMDCSIKLWDNFLLITLIESSVLIVLLLMALLFLFRIQIKNRQLRKEIDERKKVEETLKESEEKYRLIFEHSPLGLLSFDKNGVILACNDNFVKIIGSSHDVLIGLNMLKLPDKKLVAAVQMALDGSAGLYEDVYQSVTSPKISHVRALFAPIGTKGCRACGGVGIIEDVTSRKLAESELEENREKYRGLSEATFESIFLSEKGRCIEQNLTAEKIFGYTHEEAISRYGTDWIAPEDRAMVMKNMLNGFEEPYEATALKKDGTTFPCILNGKMMHYKGKVVRVTSLTDITERKKAEATIQRNLRFIEALLKSIPVPVFFMDKVGRYLGCNELFCQIMGVTNEEIMGKTVVDLWPGDESELFFQQDLQLIANPENQVYESKLKNKSGNSIDVIFAKNAFYDENGVVDGIIGAFIDITERKKMIAILEEALIKAESGNSLKTAFMNNISHEIRTPLNTIIGFSNLIILPEISNEEKVQYFSHLEASSHRLLSTITNYMDISLIASGNMEVHPNPINLQFIFLQLYAQYKPLCDNKNLILYLEIPGKTEFNLIYSDEELLRKIMTHLLNNAIKFTSNGEIRFGYSLRINGFGDSKVPMVPSSEMEFFVKDTGIGIRPEALSLIFESFKQEEFSYNRGFEGSGLGLSIAQGLVQLLGGEIGVKSVKGAGSDFYFSLPFNGIPIGTTPIEKVDNPALQDKPVILIAEDDESNLFYLQALLKKKHVSVISAMNGKQAVDLCSEHPEISLVLMDIKMPVMSGLQATTEIKKFRSELIIIACTAFGIKGDEMNALHAGCDDYLTKPLSRATLIGKLKKYGVMV